MTAIRETVPLEAGIVVGEKVFYQAVLRPAVLTDTYHAAEAVPIPENFENASVRIAYQMRIDDAVTLFQICSLGDKEESPPALDTLVQLIDPDDMATIRVGALAVKQRLRNARRGVVEPAGVELDVVL